MKTYNPSQIEEIVEQIAKDGETVATTLDGEFTGIEPSEFMAQLQERLGTDWKLTRAEPFKLTKEDVNAVAVNRFLRKTGFTLLLAWALVVSSLAMFTNTFPVIPPLAYYVLLLISSIVFIRLYATKQAKMKKEVWASLGGQGNEH